MVVLFSGLTRKKGPTRLLQPEASLRVGMGCISAHGMAYLHNGEGTINTEGHIQVLVQRMLPCR